MSSDDSVLDSSSRAAWLLRSRVSLDFSLEAADFLARGFAEALGSFW